MNEVTNQFVFIKVDDHRSVRFSLEISLTPIFINKFLQWVDVIAVLPR